MEQIECSETSAIVNQTPGNHPKEDILYSKHGESLKSRSSIDININHKLTCQSTWTGVMANKIQRPLQARKNGLGKEQEWN
jgi:hypothetical protein